MNSTPHAVIFDLDGTLLNTLVDLASAVNHSLRSYHLPEHSQDEIRWMVGNGVRLLMERAVPGGANHPLFEEIFTEFRTYYASHSQDTTAPYEGILPMLSCLKTQGVRMAVVSNKMHAATQTLVGAHFGHYIDVAIGDAPGVPRKPAPDMVLAAMRQLGVDSQHTYYVGDSDVDVMTAQNTQLSCISVLWGFRDRQFLLGHGATLFAETPQDVVDIVLR